MTGLPPLFGSNSSSALAGCIVEVRRKLVVGGHSPGGDGVTSDGIDESLEGVGVLSGGGRVESLSGLAVRLRGGGKLFDLGPTSVSSSSWMSSSHSFS